MASEPGSRSGSASSGRLSPFLAREGSVSGRCSPSSSFSRASAGHGAPLAWGVPALAFTLALCLWAAYSSSKLEGLGHHVRSAVAAGTAAGADAARPATAAPQGSTPASAAGGSGSGGGPSRRLMLRLSVPASMASTARHGAAPAAGSRAEREQVAARDALATWFPQTARCRGLPWLPRYAELHDAIRAGRQPPRYLTVVPSDGGAADRLWGLVTELYMAVLMRRALTLVASPPVYGFTPEAGCAHPYFNWTHPQQLTQAHLQPVRSDDYHTITDGSSRSDVDSRVFGHTVMASDTLHGSGVEWLSDSNVSQHKSDVPVLITSLNKGRTYAMLHNPFHSEELWEAGVSPDSAFMCGFFALCAPAPRKLINYYERYWRAMREPGVLHIGIQVRVGDSVFAPGGEAEPEDDEARAKLLAKAASHFACAEALEVTFAQPKQKVVYYLVSDSLQLRRAAKLEYGDKLLTDEQLVMTHPQCTINPAACDKATMDRAMLHSLGDILTMALADYHVINDFSGFGKMAAVLSGRWHNVYEVSGSPNATEEQRTCNPERPLSLAELSESWSGV